MKSSFRTVPIDKIDVGTRMRPIDMPWAQAIASSVEEVGLLQPIVVAETTDGFCLAAGAHRLEAIRILGKKTIEARVYSGDDVPNMALLRTLEATENVIRKDLTVLERATNLWTLKRIYEEKHPQSGHGKKRKPQANDNVGEIKVANLATLSNRFTEDVAERCGLSERVAQRLINIAEKVAPATRAKLFPTWLANHQSQLIALSEQTPIAQAKIFDLIFGVDPQAKSVAEALELINGAPKKSEQDKFYTGTINNWHRLTPKNKTAFLDLHKKDVEAYARKQGWLT